MSSRLLLFPIFVCLLTPYLHASTSNNNLYWVGPNNGFWSDPNNWSLTLNGPGGATPPSVGGWPPFQDIANVGPATSQTIQFDANNPYFSLLNLGTSGAGTAVLNVSSTGFTCDFADIAGGGVIRQSGGSILARQGFTMSGSPSHSAAYIISGNSRLTGFTTTFSGDTNVFQSGGSIIAVTNGVAIKDNTVYYLSNGGLGGEATLLYAPATLIQTGGSVGGFSGFFMRPSAGRATYELRGGNLDGPRIQIDSGTLNQSGGSVLTDQNLGIGQLNILDQGIYNLSAGTATVDQITVGDATTTAQFNITGGSVSTNFGLGVKANSLLSLHGGTLSSPAMSLDGSMDISPQTSTTLAAYTQSSTGNLDLELDGDAPGQYAGLSPSTSASLAGELTIYLGDNFSPSLGDSFQLIDAPALAGAFTSYNLPLLDNGLQWQPIYTPTTFSLSVVAPEPDLPAVLFLGSIPLVFLSRRRQIHRPVRLGILGLSFSILYLLSSTLSSPASAAIATDKYWVGPNNGLWSDPNNWSLTPGGPGGAGPPAGGFNGGGDIARVNPSSSETIFFDPTSPAFDRLELSSSGRGTVVLDVSQGGLSCASETVGPGAVLRQSGGSVFLKNGGGVSGTDSQTSAYIISPGASVNAFAFGFSGNTNVFQSGGIINAVASGVTVAGNVNYFLSGGGAGGEAFIMDGPATLILSGTGGVGGFSGSFFGTRGTGPPTVEMRGGAISGSSVFIENAVIHQSGGSVSPSGSGGQAYQDALLKVAQNAGSFVDYDLSAGAIQAYVFRLGDKGTAHLNMSGGRIAATQTSVGATSNLTMSGGSISSHYFAVGGQLSQSAGTITASDFSFGATASVSIKGGTILTTDMDAGGSIDIAAIASIALAAYTQSSTGNLDLELDGSSPSQYASLDPTTSASLAGQLSIDLANNFSPSLGDSFLLIDSPSLTGTFSSYNLPPLSNGLQWQPTYTPTSFSLSVVVPEPGAIVCPVAIALFFLTSRPLRLRGLRG